MSTPTLEAWARRFEIDHDPSFLVGTTRQEVLEAMGYRFRRGLATLPASRGAVALVQASPTTAELSLAILLADHPARTGRWVIVGGVVEGLELADEISVRPLADVALRDYRPRHPVPIERAALLPHCNRSAEGALP
jgi:hypothetical protein